VPGFQAGGGHGRETQPSVAATELEEASRLLGDLAAHHDSTARHAERPNPAAPESPRLGHAGPAFPLGTAKRRTAILQPPALEIPPSPWIMERTADRDLDREAGG
jgi:hypothetical protein